jgi:hypothetical protein
MLREIVAWKTSIADLPGDHRISFQQPGDRADHRLQDFAYSPRTSGISAAQKS